MPSALVETIAGPYNGAYNSQPIGLTETGFQLRFAAEKQIINQSHLYGDTILDAVYRGGNCILSFVCIEFNKANVRSMLWPYGPPASVTTEPNGYGFLGTIGRMDVGSSIAKSMILTAVTGTTAVASPATMTFGAAVRAEGSENDYMLGPVQRTVPVNLRLYPYSVTDPSGFAAGSYEVWFEET
jgi:hypothetical protein